MATFVVVEDGGRQVEVLASDLLRRAAALPTEPLGKESVPATVVCIDDSALRRYGHWPWPWTRLADVVTVLRECGAPLIVFDIELSEADPPRVLQHTGPDGRPVRQIVETVPLLVDSVRTAGCVIIPFNLYFVDREGAEDQAMSIDKILSAEEHAAQGQALAILSRREAVALPEQEAAGLGQVENFQPMIFPLAEVCAGAGYTSIKHDRDGVIRRVPLLARKDDKVYPHLMLESAGMWQFGPGYRVALVGNRLFLSSADGQQAFSVPTNEKAEVELRWPTGPDAITRLSVKAVLGAAEWGRYRSAMRHLDRLFPEAGWSAASRRLDEARLLAFGGKPDAPTPEAIAGLEKALMAIEERLAMTVADLARSGPEAGGNAKPDLAQDTARQYLEIIAGCMDNKETLDAYLAEVRPKVSGRLCVLGYYASAFDLHTTPIGRDQPGVTVYPAGIRTILSGVAFRHLDRWQEWVVAVLAAWLTAVLTVHLSIKRGVAATIALSAAIVGIAWAFSAKAALLLPVAGPVLAMLVAYAGVATYHELTEASSRRWITRVFEQYTSADRVDEILRDPEQLRLGGMRRDITVLFSDIAGFTPLSERLEPERLVALLNHYLSAMTGMLLAEKATLDKYEGDGILAFFGAPVAMPDHALRAVRAGLAMQAALPRINQELIQMGLLPEGTHLAMRVGCSSGPAIVGNFGSDQRFDYTCMGDTVNLGGRLEEANRWLGTRVLVPEPTREACGEAILFRRLGLAKIRGKAKPLPLYEPLAVEPAPDDLKRAAEAFGRAIDALQAADVAAAEAALADLLAARPDDGPAQTLKTRIEAVKADQAAPAEPWNLARPKQDS